MIIFMSGIFGVGDMRNAHTHFSELQQWDPAEVHAFCGCGPKPRRLYSFDSGTASSGLVVFVHPCLTTEPQIKCPDKCQLVATWWGHSACIRAQPV